MPLNDGGTNEIFCRMVFRNSAQLGFGLDLVFAAVRKGIINKGNIRRKEYAIFYCMDIGGAIQLDSPLDAVLPLVLTGDSR